MLVKRWIVAARYEIFEVPSGIGLKSKEKRVKPIRKKCVNDKEWKKEEKGYSLFVQCLKRIMCVGIIFIIHQKKNECFVD